MDRSDPHSYTDVRQGVIEHIDLELDVDFDTCCLQGVAELHLQGTATGKLNLDTRDLAIRRVVGDDGQSYPFNLCNAEGFMGSKLVIDVPAGVERIKIHYSTFPAASALQWLAPNQTAGNQYPFLYSQCQAIHARSIVPLQDSPRVRFTYHAELKVPQPLSAVMSAAPGEKKDSNDSDKSVFSFDMPQPIPSYLLALAVGRFEAQDIGPRTRVYAEPETLKAAAWEFADAEKMLETAEEIFGKYLWDRFDFIVMPPSFPFGGMENPRLTFLTPSLLAEDRSLVNVLAHELAHSWTGNLVTNATMDDFWLNEGFTVWAERRITEKLAGEDETTLAMALGRNGLESELRRFGYDSPLTKLNTDLKGIDPDEVYSQIPYEKGFLFLLLIEHTVGRERFDEFVKDYVNEFKFRSIFTDDFEAFFNEKLPGVSETVLADAWIHGPGLPPNSPKIKSERLDELQVLAAGFKSGIRPEIDEAKKWSASEWQVYLQGLPTQMSLAECQWLDDSFALTQSSNFEILALWLVIAASSSYAPAFDRMSKFLSRMGRMKFLKPLYTALVRNKATEPQAKEYFEKYQSVYHPIARAGLHRIIYGYG